MEDENGETDMTTYFYIIIAFFLAVIFAFLYGK